MTPEFSLNLCFFRSLNLCVSEITFLSLCLFFLWGGGRLSFVIFHGFLCHNLFTCAFNFCVWVFVLKMSHGLCFSSRKLHLPWRMSHFLWQNVTFLTACRTAHDQEVKKCPTVKNFNICLKNVTLVMALNHDMSKPWLRLKHRSQIFSKFPVRCITFLYSSCTIPGFFCTCDLWYCTRRKPCVRNSPLTS